jgi:hypothetical protein
LRSKKVMTRQEKKSGMTTIVESWQSSGLSQIEFAQTHGIWINPLRYWITKGRTVTEGSTGFIQVEGSLFKFLTNKLNKALSYLKFRRLGIW